jgi:hypothetical protein
VWRWMVRPVILDIVTPMVTTLGHCPACNLVFNEAGVNRSLGGGGPAEFPPELVEESQRLLGWIRELARLYRHRVRIRVTDVSSFGGALKAFRYRIRAYPAFIVDGRDVVIGWNREQLEGLIDRHLEAAAAV